MARGELLIRLDGAAVVDAATGAEPGVRHALDGRTFQIHVIDEKLLRLYPVLIEGVIMRCPAVIAGGRCGKRSGHDGPHEWDGGD